MSTPVLEFAFSYCEISRPKNPNSDFSKRYPESLNYCKKKQSQMNFFNIYIYIYIYIYIKTVPQHMHSFKVTMLMHNQKKRNMGIT